MKFPIFLLPAAFLLAPLSATAADDPVRKMACGFVQDAYDVCPNGICKTAVVKLNRGSPGCSIKLDPASLAAPSISPFDKPLSALAKAKIPIVESLKASLAKLKSSGESGNSAAAAENPNLWKPNPNRKTRKLVAADGTVIDPFDADTVPTSADLDQFYAVEKQRIEDEERERREHERAVERERQRLLAAAAEKEREEEERREREWQEEEERREQKREALLEEYYARREYEERQREARDASWERLMNSIYQSSGGGGGGNSTSGCGVTTSWDCSICGGTKSCGKQ